MSTDMNLMVGGEAGQGVQSVGFILAKAFARGGYHIFTDQDYESRIRGGHNFTRVRVKDSEVGAVAEPVDILLALNRESIDLHQEEVTPDGVIIYDGEKIKDISSGGNFFGVPLEKLAEQAAGNKLASNTVAVGVALGLTGYDFEIAAEVLREHFGTTPVGEGNVQAAQAGCEYVTKNFTRGFSHHLSPLGRDRRMLLTGNEAIALGALAAGCKFMAAYPMTPSTPILEYMAGKAAELGLAVVQPEDEIAAIGMVVGAAFAGVRAMTATSGGGFCLMVEYLGMAGMAEIPIVVVEGQRVGPGIGFPTRPEQGDLLFCLHAAHGEFPRVVLAVDTVENAFWLTTKAFNLAERYQLPVIILNDVYLANASTTVEPFDFSKVTIDRGQLLSEEEVAKLGEYKRHQITPSGISPRALPGLSKALVVTAADEHSEEGHLIEDAETRTKMVLKRLGKLESLKNDISLPRRYGPQKAEVTLIGWGSTYGALKETIDLLGDKGLAANLVNFSELWPFPADAVASMLKESKKSFVVENNATGQLARLIRAETGIKASGNILKFDGRPFTPAQIVREVERQV